MSKALATNRTLHCPTCQIEIGRYAVLNHKVYILHGAILARQFIHHCAIDGKSFYWDGRSEDEKTLPELVTAREIIK
jgi:hypothetical protein